MDWHRDTVTEVKWNNKKASEQDADLRECYPYHLSDFLVVSSGIR
jgi:hypothetical protein